MARNYRLGRISTLSKLRIIALPDARLPFELAQFRERFRELVGDRRYGEYVASVDSDFARMSPGKVRAELLSLAERLRNIQEAVLSQQSLRVHLSARALACALLVLFPAAYVYWQATAWGVAPPLLLVVIFGSLGGFISVQQRLQSQGEADAVLRQQVGWHGMIAFGPLTGAAAAVLLYGLFLADFVAGDVFPAFPASGVSKYHPLTFADLVRQSVPPTLSDYGKLAMWSFIAGFAERLIPDILTRIAGRPLVQHPDWPTPSGTTAQAASD